MTVFGLLPAGYIGVLVERSRCHQEPVRTSPVFQILETDHFICAIKLVNYHIAPVHSDCPHYGQPLQLNTPISMGTRSRTAFAMSGRWSNKDIDPVSIEKVSIDTSHMFVRVRRFMTA